MIIIPDEKLKQESASIRKSQDNLGQNVAESLSKMGVEVTDYIKKTAEKRYRDIFKDIEIKRREFFLLCVIGQSLSAIIILNIVKFVQFFQTDFNQFLGTLGIALGLILGLILSSAILRKIEKRYPFLAITLIFSSLIHLTYPWLTASEMFIILQVGVMGIVGFIFGISVVIYTTFFIESTSITERGRVIALNFILIFFSAVIFLFCAITDFLSLIVGVVPLLTAIFLFKIQKSEKIDPKRFEPKLPIKARLRNNRSLLFYAVIFLAFSISIGLFFPLSEIENFLLNNISGPRFFFILLGSLVLAAIILFLIGYVYDFAGRRIVIGLAAVIIGVLNYIQIYLHTFEPLIVAATFLVTLVMAIPLVAGDFSPTTEIPLTNGIFLLITLFGTILGIFWQGYFTDIGSKEATVMILAIVILFILMNMKEIISSKERSWPDMLFHLYVIHESGILIYEHSFRKIDTEVESDLISGGIIGLTTMLNEIVRGNQRLRIIDHGDKKILFRYSTDQKIIYVLLIKDDLLVIRNKLRNFAGEFESRFAREIANFSGVNSELWKDTIEIVQKNFKRKYFLT